MSGEEVVSQAKPLHRTHTPTWVYKSAMGHVCCSNVPSRSMEVNTSEGICGISSGVRNPSPVADHHPTVRE